MAILIWWKYLDYNVLVSTLISTDVPTTLSCKNASIIPVHVFQYFNNLNFTVSFWFGDHFHAVENAGHQTYRGGCQGCISLSSTRNHSAPHKYRHYWQWGWWCQGWKGKGQGHIQQK